MTDTPPLHFGPFLIDPNMGCLWKNTTRLKLKPKVFTLLCYLVERAGRLVTKEEIFAAVWPETVVSEAALTVSIRELRRALGDDAKEPQYLETVHRRGFRFIAPIHSPAPHGGLEARDWELVSTSPPLQSENQAPSPKPQAPTLVGREMELARLHGWLDKVLNSERQIIFVTGEPGIGKTTLVDAFLTGLASDAPRRESAGPTPNTRRPTPGVVLVGWGQCIEQYGAGEAYLPLLEAIGRLGRETLDRSLVEVLQQYAPTWLVQLPALLNNEELAEAQRRVQGATQERMLRELAEALEVWTAEQPLILWLEDLQWSDASTVKWISYMARRQTSAKLCLIGTYRPGDVFMREHPLWEVKQELALRRQCHELAVEFLTEQAVEEYLGQRLGRGDPHATLSQTLTPLLHRRTGGNPLFMVTVVDEWVRQGRVIEDEWRWRLQGALADLERELPESLQQLIERQFIHSTVRGQAVLTAASVAGAEFTAATVAAGAAMEEAAVEEQCEELVRRRQFLQAAGTEEWPDGTVTQRYGFRHALYQEMLYTRLTARRRGELHRRIGVRIEQGYGKRAREVAAELALHFEQGRDSPKAIRYLQQAGEDAVRRSAHTEAIALLTKGLELLKTLPETSERSRQELGLQLALGPSLMTTRGYGASDVQHLYTRARELCQQLGETPQLFLVLRGLYVFHQLRGEIRTASELGVELLSLAQRVQDSALLLEAHFALGQALLFQGELSSALGHLEQGIALYDSQQHRSHAFLYGQDPGVFCLALAAWALWFLGYPDRAVKRSREALILAQEGSHPNSLGAAFVLPAHVRLYRREAPIVEERAEEAMAFATVSGGIKCTQ